MPTYSECPVETGTGVSDFGTCEWTTLLTSDGVAVGGISAFDLSGLLSSTADASSSMYADKTALCVSTAVAASTVSPSAVVNVSSSSTADAVSSPSMGTEGSLTSTADAVSTPLFLVDTLVTSSGEATSTDSAAATKEWVEVSVANATEISVISRELSLAETGVAASDLVASTDTFLTSSATAADTPSPGAVIVDYASSDGAGSDASVITMTATTFLVSLASGKSTPMPVSPHDVSYAFWSNSRRMAASLWTGLPFESYASHEGQLVAAGVDGIYVFGANDDSGDPVIATITSDLLDFSSQYLKCFEAVQIAGTLAGPLKLTVGNDEVSYDSETHLPSSAVAKLHRAPIGRGYVSLYTRFTLENSAAGYEGKDFKINGVTVRVGDTMRVRSA